MTQTPPTDPGPGIRKAAEATRARQAECDRVCAWLVAAVAALLAVGIVLVYSASAIRADEQMGTSLYFLKRQALWIGFGLAAAFALSRIDYRRYYALRWPLLVATVGLLVTVLVLGRPINGARRWLHPFGYSVQPSELAKYALVVVLAAFLAHGARNRPMTARRFAGLAGLVLMAAGLVAAEPDLGTALLLAGVLFAMLLAAGARVLHMGLLLAGVGPVALWLMLTRYAHVAGRIQAWLQGGSEGKAHHAFMSLQTLGSGGLLGMGPGAGWAKLYYLPEAHTDFIYAVGGQELGLVGALGILAAYAVLVGCGLRLAMRAPDAFARYLVFGITLMLGAQAAMHIAVVTASVPTKGISLPLVSFGGSGLVCALAGIGMLVSVARHAYAPAGRLAAGADSEPWSAHFLARASAGAPADGA